SERFRSRKFLIAPFFREETGQEGMIRLPDQQQLVALFPNDQTQLPSAAGALRSRLLLQGVPARQRDSQASLDRLRYYAPPNGAKPSPCPRLPAPASEPTGPAFPGLPHLSPPLQISLAHGSEDPPASLPPNRSVPKAHPLRLGFAALQPDVLSESKP